MAAVWAVRYPPAGTRGVDGVDGTFIGSSYLAASMGHPGNVSHREAREAILGAIARLKALGKPAGILMLDEEFARTCIASRKLFTAVGVDMSLLIREVDALARRFGLGQAK
ncbi:aldolase/citrate lyase family protein [Ostreiculturibacter nitratireducens]|uniref:aldolase/citrate lyase family protein n=1 Tax=Ostreiculturibacter nitratireducens TaxID=3075226 RepID=UPI0031B5C8B6